MLDSYVIFIAFSAYTLILIALGYVLRILWVDYRMMRMIVQRTVNTRDEHMKKQVAEWQAALSALLKAKREMEQERAALAKAKGMSA